MSANRLQWASVALVLFAPLVPDAAAQDVELKPLDEITRGKSFEDVVASGLLDLNLAVPESPAFTALGMNPEEITRPASPREFATAILTGLDRNGNFQAGLAIDTVPYLLIDGRNLSLRTYREDRSGFNWRRQLARTTLSLATTKGTDKDDESLRLGLGLRVTPWTKGDPRMDDSLIYCLDRAAFIPSPPKLEESGDDFLPQPTDPAADDAQWERVQAYGDILDAWEPKAEKKAEACLDPAEERLNKASAWDIGLAPTWIQKGGSSRNISWGGGTLWTSFAWNFAETSADAAPLPRPTSLKEWERWQPAVEDPRRRARPQLITHVRFRLDETVANDRAPGGFYDQNSLLAGARLRWGSPSLTFSLDGAYLYENPNGFSADNSFRGGLAAEIKLYEQFWIQLALGGTAGRSDDRIQIGASFKWGGRSTDLSQILGLVRGEAIRADSAAPGGITP